MDVEQRQPVGEDVLAGPLPGVGEPVEVGGDRAARELRALGAAGGAARVDDQRRVLVAGGAVRQLAVARVEVDATPSGPPSDDVGRRVGQHVLELAAAELRVDGHERRAGDERGDGGDARLERRLRPHRDAFGAVEVLGHRRGGLAQLAVAQPAVADRDRRLPASLEDLVQHRAGRLVVESHRRHEPAGLRRGRGAARSRASTAIRRGAATPPDGPRDARRAQPGERVLDVGCGPGFYCAELAEEVGPSARWSASTAARRCSRWRGRRCAGLGNVELRAADATALGRGRRRLRRRALRAGARVRRRHAGRARGAAPRAQARRAGARVGHRLGDVLDAGRRAHAARAAGVGRAPHAQLAAAHARAVAARGGVRGRAGAGAPARHGRVRPRDLWRRDRAVHRARSSPAARA